MTYKAKANKLGITVNETYRGVRVKIAHTCNTCKRQDWMITPNYVLSGKAKECMNCSNERRRKFDAQSYKNIVMELKGIVVLGEYINNYTPINHICPICNRDDWKVAPKDMLDTQTGLLCHRCSAEQGESIMATVLKQVLKHEYPLTKIECDLGYRGVNGGISRYDIVVPELALVVECQSEFHDGQYKSSNDKLKKKYAMDLGYRFMELDSREYTGILACRVFFKDMYEIPEYVVLEKSKRSYRLEEAQSLSYQGKKLQEIVEVTGYKLSTLLHYIKTGRLDYYTTKDSTK